MSRKIKEYFIYYPFRCVILFCAFLIIFTIAMSKLPIIAVKIFMVCVVILMLIILIRCLYEQKKEMQELNKEDYEKKWMQYVDLVNEMIEEEEYERNEFNMNWIEEFNKVIYAIAGDEYLLRRKFNDFDIAACLMHSLIRNKKTDKSILFAFNCAKKIISEPKTYIRDLGYGYKLELKVESISQKVNIYVPDDTITTEALVSIIGAYFMQDIGKGILQMSDFLHVLYLKCK